MPLYIDKVETINIKGVEEPSLEWFNKFILKCRDLTDSLIQIGFEKRLKVLDELGKIWTEKLHEGKVNHLIEVVAKNTGYSVRNVELDLAFISEVLSRNNLIKLFDNGLVGGYKTLDLPVELNDGEMVLNRPLSPNLIIATGNSVVPSILPAVISLASGGVTILKPSIVNYSVVVDVFTPLKDLAESMVEGASEIARSLLVTYFLHDSKVLDNLLLSAPLAVVNYWGGEPGRSTIVEKVLRNPYKPRIVINGPLTGLAIVDEDSINADTPVKLARDVVLYDQQLCSSPTYVLYIGSMSAAADFAKKLGNALDKIGSTFPRKFTEHGSYTLLLMRKKLEIDGYTVFYSQNLENPWIIAVRGSLHTKDVRTYKIDTAIPLHQRKRFVEIRVLDKDELLPATLDGLLRELSYQGVDKFQTALLAVSESRKSKLINLLARIGVYRIVPLGESFLRTPIEPYDGEFIPKYFTYTIYVRDCERFGDVVKYFRWGI